MTRPSKLPAGINAAAVEQLRTLLRGPLLLPGDAGYEDARIVCNAMIDRRPALVARPLGVADVIAAVDFARERGLTLTIKGGGHNISGLAVADGGMMLDMSLMRGVMVDPDTRIARAQPGCLLGDVDRETQLQGVAAVLGFVSNTGIAGLTLGGGRARTKTPTSSGGSAGEAATSGSSPGSTPICTRSARRSSAGRWRGRVTPQRRCWRCIGRWPPKRRAN